MHISRDLLLLHSPGTKTCGHSPANHPRMFAMLCANLSQLHETVRGNSPSHGIQVCHLGYCMLVMLDSEMCSANSTKLSEFINYFNLVMIFSSCGTDLHS